MKMNGIWLQEKVYQLAGAMKQIWELSLKNWDREYIVIVSIL